MSFKGRQVALNWDEEYFYQRKKTINTQHLMQNSTPMGQWVNNNLDYLGKALDNGQPGN